MDSSAATTRMTRSIHPTRQHVSHEALVARHVNEADTYSLAEVQVGEAKVNRYSALLLFLQAVGVNACQRQH